MTAVGDHRSNGVVLPSVHSDTNLACLLNNILKIELDRVLRDFNILK